MGCSTAAGAWVSGAGSTAGTGGTTASGSVETTLGSVLTTAGAMAADAQTAELVGVDVGAPLLWVDDVIEDHQGRPLALSQLRLRGDRVAFSAYAARSL